LTSLLDLGHKGRYVGSLKSAQLHAINPFVL
jgi:hypothetical protein